MSRPSPASFQTLVDMLDQRAATSPDEVAFIFLADGESDEHRLTYRELASRSAGVCEQLSAWLAPGSRVLMLYPSGLDFICAFFGLLRGGYIAVPAYPPEPVRLSAGLRRLEAIVNDCGAEMVLVSAELQSLKKAASAEAPRASELPWLVATNEHGDSGAGAAVSGSSIALLQYTSGSTGRPKGVILRHDQLLANQASICEAMAMPDRARIVTWLPLYHDMGLIGTIIQPLYVGGLCVLMSPHHFIQKPVRWLHAITRYRAQVSGAPNFAYELCLSRVPQHPSTKLDLSSWRVAFTGAEMVRAQTVEQFAERFGANGLSPRAIFPCYGLAEASLLVTGGPPDRRVRVLDFDRFDLEHGKARLAECRGDAARLVSCGRPPANQEVCIASQPGLSEPAPEGVIGEVLVQGASISSGYWGDRNATAAAFIDNERGRWLRTGDLGFLRGGELFVTGRLKELIILRGRNFAPAAIEASAQALDDRLRRDCGAAFGVDIDGEERLVLVQELRRAGRSDLAELEQRVRARVLADHGVELHDLRFVNPHVLSKTRNGKIERVACRAAYLSGRLPGVMVEVTEVFADEQI